MKYISPFTAKPSKIRLDATTFCQLKCPSCPTANGIIKNTLGSKHLNFKIFKSLLEDNPQINHVELSNWGELFLNPQLIKMLELAYKKGVKLTASNGSNMNYIRPEVLEGLVKYKFEHITCSIDGVTQEVYEKYRKKGEISSVFKNIEKINEYKSTYNSEHPKLTWQFIVFNHNFHEIPEAKRLAEKYNMKIGFKLSWDDSLAPDPKHSEWISKETGLQAVSRPEYKKKNDESYRQKYICSQLWNQPQINSDGKVLGCCVNTWGDFGNYKEGSIETLVNGEKMTYARKMLMGRAEPKKDIPCTTCHNYIEMKKDNDWISKEFLGYRSRLDNLIESGEKIKYKLKKVF